MALPGHAADNVRRGLHHVPHHEEGGGGVVLLQRVQDWLRVSVLVTAVKGQIDYFFGTIPQIIRPVFGQLLLGGIAHGGLALVLEGQAPVPGHGDGGGGPGGADRLLTGQGEDHGGGEQQRGQRREHPQRASVGMGHGWLPPFDESSLVFHGKRSQTGAFCGQTGS